MGNRKVAHGWVACALMLCVACAMAAAQETATRPAGPAKIYVPYEKLKGVFESEKQGVFLPYAQFRRLWQAARGAPAGVAGAPVPYLISTARFEGKVGAELAAMQMELTVDVLAEGWVEVPIGLGEVAVAKAAFAEAGAGQVRPLLRVVGGQYRLVTKGTGRYVLKVDFVRQLIAKPGLNVLRFRTPAAAISTLELVIPEENMKVDVKPMLAATTSQVDAEGKKSTRLQAFLGSAESVELSWKPKTQAAAELAAVVIAEQLQHIDVAEALIRHEVSFRYDIRRRGVDAFTIQLPGNFRVISVAGANISKWDIPARPGGPGPQTLQVKLFSPAKDQYALTVKMERFLKEAAAQVVLTPVVTQQVLRRTGLIAVTHSPRRSVELREAKALARVDTGRLPANLRKRPGVTAWRFITADYGGKLAIASVAPRITANHYWALGIGSSRLELRGNLSYQVERAGVFQLSLNLPERWRVVSMGPAKLVDDHQFAGKGPQRKLNILLKREMTGGIQLKLTANAVRPAEDAPVDFALPLPDAENLRLYNGELMVYLHERLRAEVEALRQFQPKPLARANRWASIAPFSPAMAFEFRSVDASKPAGARFKIAVKPTQVSAEVHRLVDIQPGSVREEAIVAYHVRYAAVDTFYLKMPAALADAEVQIAGDPDPARPRIKEKPRIDALPADQRAKAPPTQPAASAPASKWAYYKIVLQLPVLGRYRVRVTARRSFQAGGADEPTPVVVHPILAAGRLADQRGQIAVAKADTLAVLSPAAENLTPADPGSAADLPHEPHRRLAALAFKYGAPPFALSLPVVTQKEAAVITTMVTGAMIEQVLAPDGMLNTRAVYLLATSRGDRLAITLPPGATPYQFLLNGQEAAVEAAPAGKRIVRLPPSAGQVGRFVLEVSYGVAGARAGALGAPTLPEEIPFQQTLWRVWLPEEDYVLGHDRRFSRIDRYQAEQLLGELAAGQPAPVRFGREREGQALHFVRQGAPGELSVLLADKRWFSVIVWAAVLAAGAAMLKLRWFHRCVVVLAAAAAGLGVGLFSPLLSARLALTASPAAALVLLLWVAQWLFVAVPGRLEARRRARASAAAAGAPPPPPSEPAPQAPDAEQPPQQPGQEQAGEGA